MASRSLSIVVKVWESEGGGGVFDDEEAIFRGMSVCTYILGWGDGNAAGMRQLVAMYKRNNAFVLECH